MSGSQVVPIDYRQSMKHFPPEDIDGCVGLSHQDPASPLCKDILLLLNSPLSSVWIRVRKE